MSEVQGLLENFLYREVHAQIRVELKKKFPELENCPHQGFLTLGRYLNKLPEKFYCRETYAQFSEWLFQRNQQSPDALKQYFKTQLIDLDRALLHLDEINALDWHDSLNDLKEYELIQFIDRNVHPTYLRLIEAVFAIFIKTIAYFSRVDRGAGTDGLDIYTSVQELGGSDFQEALSSYHHLMRNSIAHGGIAYLQGEVCYKDKKGNEEIVRDLDIVRTVDDLLDVCNGFTLALTVFFLRTHSVGYEMPRKILLNELREQTRTPWWNIVGTVECKIGTQNQFVIYSQVSTLDYHKVQLSTFQSGILAEQFASGFDTYFFSMKTDHLPGFALLDGAILKAAREKISPALSDYKGVIKNDLLFYIPRFKVPKIFLSFQNILLGIKVHLPIAFAKLRSEFNRARIIARNIEIHRTAWVSVVNGSVYIENDDRGISRNLIRRERRSIIRVALRKARERKPKRTLSIAKYLPLGFARISVFKNDYRRRRLNGYGLGEDLICTIQVRRIGRIKSPDIFGSTIEQIGSYRIAWNKAWLEQMQ